MEILFSHDITKVRCSSLWMKNFHYFALIVQSFKITLHCLCLFSNSSVSQYLLQFFLLSFFHNQIVHPLDETQCFTCPMGALPDIFKQQCDPIPEVYMRPESVWAIGAMSFSAIGILITLFVTGVFVK